MDILFDPAKNARYIALRGISFERAKEFDWSLASIVEDVRREYGERRFRATGTIADRLHVLVFTQRDGIVHVISLRKANKREIRRHAAQTQSQRDTN